MRMSSRFAQLKNHPTRVSTVLYVLNCFQRSSRRENLGWADWPNVALSIQLQLAFEKSCKFSLATERGRVM